jgi:3-oxoacyl-[acyl-carrier protein] reductase
MSSTEPNLPLKNKVALVTGASRGIGRAIAEKLAHANTRVMLTARDETKLKEAVATIAAAGGTAAFCVADLREEAAATTVIAETLRVFGQLDILVNNAGATKRGDFSALTDADFQDGFALKFFGAVRLTRLAWPHLKITRGAIINIAGVGGRTPGPQFTIGGSVNAAMLSFTKAIADVGLTDGVHVAAINPGMIRTDRFQTRLQTFAKEKGLDLAAAETQMVKESGVARIGEPSDVANLVAYLVSPAGSYLHGSIIDLDGGQTKTW